MKTCEKNEINIYDFAGIEEEIKKNGESLSFYLEKNGFQFIIDAIFGFSFKLPIRSPYDYIINELKLTKIPILSVDIPSGWDVENGCSNVFIVFLKK